MTGVEPTASGSDGPVAAGVLRFGGGGHVRRRLYCLPFAGGGPSTYRVWPQHLPDDVEVCAIVLPGRDPRTASRNGESPPGLIGAIVPSVLSAVAAIQRESPVPFAIFGHSMGSLVAFEMTVALEAEPDRCGAPEHLFVSGRRPPDELHSAPSIHDLPDDEFLDALQASYGGVPDVVRGEPELLALFLPALRADVQVFETYAPLSDRKVACPVRAYGGLDDTRPRPEQLSGWARVTEQPIEIQTFPGDHFYLATEVQQVTRDLANAWSSTARGDA